jgi:hypothetical protein
LLFGGKFTDFTVRPPPTTTYYRLLPPTHLPTVEGVAAAWVASCIELSAGRIALMCSVALPSPAHATATGAGSGVACVRALQHATCWWPARHSALCLCVGKVVQGGRRGDHPAARHDNRHLLRDAFCQGARPQIPSVRAPSLLLLVPFFFDVSALNTSPESYFVIGTLFRCSHLFARKPIGPKAALVEARPHARGRGGGSAARACERASSGRAFGFVLSFLPRRSMLQGAGLGFRLVSGIAHARTRARKSSSTSHSKARRFASPKGAVASRNAFCCVVC